MNKLQLLQYMTERAKKYREGAPVSIARNHHMNDLAGAMPHQDVIDAVLVDFINAVAQQGAIDYALYTADLKPKPPEPPEGLPCNCTIGCKDEHISLERPDGMIRYCVKNNR